MKPDFSFQGLLLIRRVKGATASFKRIKSIAALLHPLIYPFPSLASNVKDHCKFTIKKSRCISLNHWPWCCRSPLWYMEGHWQTIWKHCTASWFPSAASCAVPFIMVCTHIKPLTALWDLYSRITRLLSWTQVFLHFSLVYTRPLCLPRRKHYVVDFLDSQYISTKLLFKPRKKSQDLLFFLFIFYDVQQWKIN